MAKKKEFYKYGKYLYYPVESSSYKLDLILAFIWNLGLISAMIYLIINYSGWWFLLLFITDTPHKIARRELE